ncbi:alpha-galactosidase [Butyrivibrio proteoclasticus]|uniref:alpha-galactosidase n=1 Tax=Butyrivibrio proteoclasticus TaxID=43305 RepID=UPI00047E7B99|nr:alpha-galactosidase [Butyrivibrio proteoclasticus]
MGVKYNDKEKQFHLFNEKISYCLGVSPDGEVGHLFFGKRINEDQTLPLLQSRGIRPLMCNLKEDEDYTKELALLEYPAFGNGDFRSPAYEVLQGNGSRVTNLTYHSYDIYSGKKSIPGLPAAYTNSDDEATTLEITCRDDVAGLEVVLFYTIWEKYPIISRHASIRNVGTDQLTIERALSCCIDFPDQDYNWLQFQGAWGRERVPVERNLSDGITAIESMRGHSSANYNPFVIVKRANTDEENGEAIGIHLLYSGNFLAQAEGDVYGRLRFEMGINPKWFSWPLKGGESFETPEVMITYTKSGLNDLSQNIHSFINNHIVRSNYKNKPRPILLNNWEATEMNFDEEKILNIARKGKEAGVELFVLDDGWFGKRNNDYAGLGDWFVNTNKLPNGIAGLSKKINELGLKFGIWIEPEMVNEDSELYRAHPDYVLGAPDRARTLGRHQMVLDFSKKEVVDNIYDQLYGVFADTDISYVKWDMNRSITECYSLGGDPDKQGTVYHRYIMGVYDLYERLRKAFPEILFESCSSGGSRFDAGILHYAPQTWCSDDTDARERIRIQYGTSYGYPISSIGAHVSASPNLQTGRATTIDARANVACFGTFGYELDLNEISEEDFERVKEQIKFMKEYRELLQFGRFYRLSSPFKKNLSSWMVVSKDQSTAIVAIYKDIKQPNEPVSLIRLQGLKETALYTLNGEKEFYGDYLMESGIPSIWNEEPWYATEGDFTSKIYVLKSNVTK